MTGATVRDLYTISDSTANNFHGFTTAPGRKLSNTGAVYMENREIYWRKFMASGSVSDYLKYSAVRKMPEENSNDSEDGCARFEGTENR